MFDISFKNELGKLSVKDSPDIKVNGTNIKSNRNINVSKDSTLKETKLEGKT